MKLVALTGTSATFETHPHERADLARLFMEDPSTEFGYHWTGPRTSSWWQTWHEASKKIAPYGGNPLPGALLTVTAGHLALLRHASTGWQYAEFGAPEINPKRPYGNSAVLGDIAEILGEALPDDDDGADYSDEFVRRAHQLHRETEFCLQILLETAGMGGLEEGATYRNDAAAQYFSPRWVKVQGEGAP